MLRKAWRTLKRTPLRKDAAAIRGVWRTLERCFGGIGAAAMLRRVWRTLKRTFLRRDAAAIRGVWCTLERSLPREDTATIRGV